MPKKANQIHKDYLYMAVTPDKYELPIAVAETPTELGKLVGRSAVLISSSICHQRDGRFTGMKFVRVEL